MIHIVTGKINSNKTTKLLEMYQKNPVGDGFLSIKVMDNNKVLHYDLLELSTNISTTFIVHTKHDSTHFERSIPLGPYIFDLDQRDIVNNKIQTLLEERVEPIYLDEIGILEVRGLYFYDIVKELVESGLEVYITVRDSLVEDVLKTFDIKEYEIIT